MCVLIIEYIYAYNDFDIVYMYTRIVRYMHIYTCIRVYEYVCIRMCDYITRICKKK